MSGRMLAHVLDFVELYVFPFALIHDFEFDLFIPFGAHADPWVL